AEKFSKAAGRYFNPDNTVSLLPAAAVAAGAAAAVAAAAASAAVAHPRIKEEPVTV
ncbi:hypothetical protein JYU34_017780, partial [Plutella xylostella]